MGIDFVERFDSLHPLQFYPPKKPCNPLNKGSAGYIHFLILLKTAFQPTHASGCSAFDRVPFFCAHRHLERFFHLGFDDGSLPCLAHFCGGVMWIGSPLLST